jgi:Subtilase family
MLNARSTLAQARFHTFLLSLFLVSTTSQPAPAAPAAPAKRLVQQQKQKRTQQQQPLRADEFVANHLLVVPRGQLDRETFDQTLSDLHGTVVEEISNGKVACYELEFEPAYFAKAYQSMQKDKQISAVQVNMTAQSQELVWPQVPPNDPEYNQQPYLQQLQVPQAWAQYSAIFGRNIGIIDTGVNGNQSELTGRVTNGLNTVTGKATGHIDTSKDGHGTFGATIIAASTNNNLLGASPIPSTTIVPVDVFNGRTSTTDKDIIKALIYLEKQNVNIVSLPINHKVPYSFANPVAHPALTLYFEDFLSNHNGMIFNAAGNDGTYDSVPRVPYLIVCSALDTNTQAASFTNFGPSITFALPGVNIGSSTSTNTFEFRSGTSWSCSLAAALASQGYAVSGHQQTQYVFNAMQNSCSQQQLPPIINSPYPSSYYYGFGLPSAFSIVAQLNALVQ